MSIAEPFLGHSSKAPNHNMI